MKVGQLNQYQINQVKDNYQFFFVSFKFLKMSIL